MTALYYFDDKRERILGAAFRKAYREFWNEPCVLAWRAGEGDADIAGDLAGLISRYPYLADLHDAYKRAGREYDEHVNANYIYMDGAYYKREDI